MDIVVAIAHILGSIVALLLFGYVVLLIGSWESGQIQKQVAEDASLALGISVEDLDKEENARKILSLSASKFSSELFKNRLSDFCGTIRTVWGWLSNIIQAIVLIAVLWYTVTDSTKNAVYAWSLLGISIFAWLTSVIFSLICKLLTGRYPGQAKAARKVAAEWVKNNATSLTSSDPTVGNACEDENWLESDSFEEIAIQHLQKFPKRTGREIPTYEELLELEKDEFKAWMFVKASAEFQEQTLEEMINHESVTGSFSKTVREDDPPQQKLILDIFIKERSVKVIDAIRGLDKAYHELGGDNESDIVTQAIYAKAISDYYQLAERQ